MRKIRFLLVFLFSVILLGGVQVGPFSIRVYVTVIMIAALFSIRDFYGNIKANNSYIINYVLFLLLMAFSLLMVDEFVIFDFPKIFLAYHLVAIISYYACFRFIKNLADYKKVVGLLTGIMVFSSIVTILQFYNTSIGWFFSTFFSTSGLNEEVMDGIKAASTNTNMLGNSNCIGIFGYAFTNAMFIGSMSILSFHSIFDRKKPRIKKYLSATIVLLGLSACFMTQQRFVFYILVISCLIIIYKSVINKLFLYSVTLIAIIIILYSNFAIDTSGLGRMGELSFEDDARLVIWANCIDFISSNLLWGGPCAYLNMMVNLPHNFFLTALIYAGLLGGLTIIILFFRLVVKAIKIIIKGNGSSYSFLFSFSLLIYFSGGMVHNDNLVAGSAVSFILVALILIGEQLEKQTE